MALDQDMRQRAKPVTDKPSGRRRDTQLRGADAVITRYVRETFATHRSGEEIMRSKRFKPAP